MLLQYLMEKKNLYKKRVPKKHIINKPLRCLLKGHEIPNQDTVHLNITK